MTDPATWLSDDERAELAAHETTLRRGADHDLERGRALLAIRDARLYRATHATFEAYCAQPQWRLSRSRAYQLIDLAGVTAAVHTVDADAPAMTEAQARELAQLRGVPQAVGEAWNAVVELHGSQPTAAQVRDVVDERKPLAAIEPPQPPGDDLRFARIEHAADSLRALPAVAKIAWPVEPGDVAAMDEALDFICEFGPAARKVWRLHKRALRGLHAVRG